MEKTKEPSLLAEKAHPYFVRPDRDMSEVTGGLSAKGSRSTPYVNNSYALPPASGGLGVDGQVRPNIDACEAIYTLIGTSTYI